MSGIQGPEEEGKEEEGLASRNPSATRVNKPGLPQPKLLLPEDSVLGAVF